MDNKKVVFKGKDDKKKSLIQKYGLTLLTRRIVVFLMIVNLLTVGVSGVILYNMGTLITHVEDKIDIYELQRENRMLELEIDLKESISLTADYLKTQTELIISIADGAERKCEELRKTQTELVEGVVKDVGKKYKELKRIQKNILLKLKQKYEDLSNKINKRKKIDIDNVSNIKKANFYLENITRECSGAGTYIKIKRQYYILTCAHLISQDSDEMYAVSDLGSKYPITLVKKNIKDDLALFYIQKIPQITPLEISTDEVSEGSEVVIIGNPARMKDVLTDGVISKVYDRGYLFTNKIFFGNSGGAVLYKGKIIGVTTQIRTRTNGLRVFVNYGYSSNRLAIVEFLEEYTQ